MELVLRSSWYERGADFDRLARQRDLNGAGVDSHELHGMMRVSLCRARGAYEEHEAGRENYAAAPGA